MAGAQLEQARGSHTAGPQTFEAAAGSDAEKEAALRRLRDQVAGLKAEIGEQQTERRQLRKMLTNERKKLAELSQPDAPAEGPGAAEDAAIGAPAAGRSCRSIRTPSASVWRPFRRRSPPRQSWPPGASQRMSRPSGGRPSRWNVCPSTIASAWASITA